MLFSVYLIKDMSHPLLFSMHIESVVHIRRYFYGHILHNFQSISLKPYAFNGIVSHQLHFSHAKFVKYLCTHSVVSFISAVTQVQIGIYCVKPLFL